VESVREPREDVQCGKRGALREAETGGQRRRLCAGRASTNPAHRGGIPQHATSRTPSRGRAPTARPLPLVLVARGGPRVTHAVLQAGRTGTAAGTRAPAARVGRLLCGGQHLAPGRCSGEAPRFKLHVLYGSAPHADHQPAIAPGLRTSQSPRGRRGLCALGAGRLNRRPADRS